MKMKAIIICVVLILLLGSFLYLQNTFLEIYHYNISDSEILSDFKIAQVSDFHNSTNKRLVNKLVESIKEQEPDIIVLTGDLIDARNTKVDVAIDFVEKIKNVAPIYFVTGNHEASSSKYDVLKSELKDNGVIILDNKCEVIENDGFKINLVGIDDPSMYYHPLADDGDIVSDLISDINYDRNNYSILLSHRPELFDVYLNKGFDLILSGHAHGGQFRIPIIGGLYAPNQGFFPKYDNGSFIKKETTMIVSRGIGNSVIPFRINNSPQLVVVRLES